MLASPNTQSSGFARGSCPAHSLHTAASCVMSGLSGRLPHSPEKLQRFYHKLSEHRTHSGKPIGLTTVPGDGPATSARLAGPGSRHCAPMESNLPVLGDLPGEHSDLQEKPPRRPHRPWPSQGQEDQLVAEVCDQAESGPGVCRAKWEPGRRVVTGHRGLSWSPRTHLGSGNLPETHHSS